MPSFSKTSKNRLDTCDVRLQELFNKVIIHFDCSIVCGHRNKESQNAAYESGNSKLKYPESKHNANPSKAIDVAPYPIVWEDLDRIRYFAGFVMGIAASKGISLRWGGDWDQDTDLSDQTFNDLVHFEIKE